MVPDDGAVDPPYEDLNWATEPSSYDEEYWEKILSREPEGVAYVKSTEELIGIITSLSYEEEMPRDAAAVWDRRFPALMAPSLDGYTDDAPPVNWISTYLEKGDWEAVLEAHEGEKYAAVPLIPKHHNQNQIQLAALQEGGTTMLYDGMEEEWALDMGGRTAQIMYREGVPAPPTLDGSLFLERFYTHERPGFGDFDSYVVKGEDGGGGKEVQVVEGLLEARGLIEGIAEDEEDERSYLDFAVQPKIPHESDIRAIVAGKEIVNAERRYGPQDDFRTNLSQLEVEGDKYDPEYTFKKALKAGMGGRAESLDVDELPEVVHELAADAVEAYGWEDVSEGERKPFFAGLDLMEVPRDELWRLPERHEELAESYTHEDTAYMLIETNPTNPGPMVDYLAYWNGNEEQMSALHFIDLLRDMAGIEGPSPEKMANNPDSPVWRRIEDYYGELFENPMMG